MRCENLSVWKKACRLSGEIYKYFKLCKDYGFKDQITQTSLSILSNITEGEEKSYPKEKYRFLEISKGSIAELIAQIYIGIKIDYIDKKIGLKWIDRLNEIAKMVTGLSNYHRAKVDKKSNLNPKSLTLSTNLS